LLNTVAESVDQCFNQVKLRRKDIIMYQVSNQSIFAFVLKGVHPLLSPFTTYNPISKRNVRFNAYYLQVNSWVFASMLYFSNDLYRVSTKRIEFVLDQVDIT